MEDTILEVCENCLKYGELIESTPITNERIAETPVIKEENVEDTVLVDNYGKLIIESREKINLTREEFAKKINEKESVIKRVEKEEMEPDDKLIDKIEKFLSIKLTTTYESKKIESKANKGKLTIGDVLEVK